MAPGVTAAGAVRGIEEPALAALAELDRLLPPRLPARVAALRTTAVRLGPDTAVVEAEVLVVRARPAPAPTGW